MIELIFRSRGSQTVQTIVLLEMLITFSCNPKVPLLLQGELLTWKWGDSKYLLLLES